MISFINKSDEPYITVKDCILENAIRHMKRAGVHASNGNFDYADRSAEKAIKNFSKAAEFDWFKWLSSPIEHMCSINTSLKIMPGRKKKENE